MISFFSTYFRYIFSKFKIKHHRSIENILPLGILVTQYMNILELNTETTYKHIQATGKPKKKLTKWDWGQRVPANAFLVEADCLGERSLLGPGGTERLLLDWTWEPSFLFLHGVYLFSCILPFPDFSIYLLCLHMSESQCDLSVYKI